MPDEPQTSVNNVSEKQVCEPFDLGKYADISNNEINRMEIFGMNFYTEAQKFWAGKPPTIRGVLGSLHYLNSIDLKGSKRFLRNLCLERCSNALDCGAGIGRVSKYLLLPNFWRVDFVEQDKDFALIIPKYCTRRFNKKGPRMHPERIGTVFNVGLQNFALNADGPKYDLIWCQWVLGHLTDIDLFTFFKRMRNHLDENGFLVIKESVTKDNRIEKDEIDSSVTRPLPMFEYFLVSAGFEIVKCIMQEKMPKSTYQVFMIACQVNGRQQKIV